MTERKSAALSTPFQKPEQASSPSTRLHYIAGSRYAVSGERVRQFARKYPGEYVINLTPPIAPKPQKKGNLKWEVLHGMAGKPA